MRLILALIILAVFTTASAQFRVLPIRQFPPPNVWVAHFSDHRDFAQAPRMSFEAGPAGVPYLFNQAEGRIDVCADTITKFKVFNGSENEAKVRFQGLDRFGAIVYERDIVVPAGHTSDLVPDRTIPGIEIGETFVVASYVNVAIFASSFWTMAVQDVDLNFRDRYQYQSVQTVGAKRQIDFVAVDCGKPDYKWVCDTPFRLNPWIANVTPE